MPEKGSDREVCKIDGVIYPRYKNLVNSAKSKIPRLFDELDPEGKSIRRWFRENTNGVDDQHWIEHLWWVSNLYMDEGFREGWLSIDAKKRERKINRIVGTIRKLQRLLDDSALPEIPKVYELMGCFLASSELSVMMNEFCKKEGEKSPFKEEVNDILDSLVCALNRQMAMSKEVRPNVKGDALGRNFVRMMYGILYSRCLDKSGLSGVITSLVALKYPESDYSEDKINGWLREIKYNSK